MEKNGLRPGSGKVYARGLSQADYLVARKLILNGLITEQELIDAGKMLPSKGRGKPASEAKEWFLEAKRNK